jgi:hypothetical protein
MNSYFLCLFFKKKRLLRKFFRYFLIKNNIIVGLSTGAVASAPFPVPPRQTGPAELPHPAFTQSFFITAHEKAFFQGH